MQEIECEFGCFCEEPGVVSVVPDSDRELPDLDRVIQEKLARAARYRAFFDRAGQPETD